MDGKTQKIISIVMVGFFLSVSSFVWRPTEVNAAEMRNLYQEIIQGAKSDISIEYGTPAIESNGGYGIFTNDMSDAEAGTGGTSQNTSKIYYFRGGPVKNNVIYAGMCWQIVRTTPEGAMKVIYNGLPSANETCENTGLKSNLYYSVDESGLETALSVPYNEANNGDYLTSNAKTAVDRWFEENLMDYKDELADVMFCNDTDWQNEHKRLSEHRNPTFSCASNHQLSVSNQKLQYPIAIIDADELMYSGATYNGDPIDPNGYYIDTGKFHSMTQESVNKMFYNNSKHHINRTGGTDYSTYLRAVIALPNKTTFINTGDGSKEDPYRITHVEPKPHIVKSVNDNAKILDNITTAFEGEKVRFQVDVTRKIKSITFRSDSGTEQKITFQIKDSENGIYELEMIDDNVNLEVVYVPEDKPVSNNTDTVIVNPQTSDNIWLYVGVLAASIVGIFVLLAILIKFTKR